MLTGAPAPRAEAETEEAPLGTVGKYLQQLESALQMVVRIAHFLRTHWKVATISGVVGLVWLLGWSHAYLGPARFLEGYFDLVGRRDLEAAWRCIHPSFQESTWEGDVRRFASQYETTISSIRQEIAPADGRSSNPFRVASALLATQVRYDVVNEVTNRFTRENCLDPVHEMDCLAARLTDKDAFEALMDGRRKTQHLKRVLKKRYTLDRDSPTGDWRITETQLLETRIPLQKTRP